LRAAIRLGVREITEVTGEGRGGKRDRGPGFKVSRFQSFKVSAWTFMELWSVGTLKPCNFETLKLLVIVRHAFDFASNGNGS
jgi:hypothetical protein